MHEGVLCRLIFVVIRPSSMCAIRYIHPPGHPNPGRSTVCHTLSRWWDVGFPQHAAPTEPGAHETAFSLVRGHLFNMPRADARRLDLFEPVFTVPRAIP